MRRAVARGRVFPQSYSTDRRYGRISLQACALFPLMWVNADDQGRLCGDPEEIKYAVCPNIDHITKTDIPGLLRELHENELILLYNSPKSAVIQLLDWWDPHRAPQWAWPSDYPPPKGWMDHLRYKKDAHTVETLNWPLSGEYSGEYSGEKVATSQVSINQGSGENPGENSGETPQKTPSFPQTPIHTSKKGTGGRRGRGKRNSPENPGEKTPSPPAGVLSSEMEILHRLTELFKKGWGKVTGERPFDVIPREPTYKETAQLRDLAKELAAAGCPLEAIDEAFKGAAGQNKMRISYVRAIILDNLGVERKVRAERK